MTEIEEAIRLAIVKEPHPLTFGELLDVLEKNGMESPSEIFTEFALRQLTAKGEIRNMMSKKSSDVRAGIFYVPDQDNAHVVPVLGNTVETTQKIA